MPLFTTVTSIALYRAVLEDFASEDCPLLHVLCHLRAHSTLGHITSFVQGPPGAGKSYALALTVLVCAAVNPSCRILWLAVHNVTLVSAAAELVRFLDEGSLLAGELGRLPAMSAAETEPTRIDIQARDINSRRILIMSSLVAKFLAKVKIEAPGAADDVPFFIKT